MFASPELAARIDRAEGRLCAAIAEGIGARHPDFGTFVADLGGGVAVFAGSGSPTNKMIGLGFDAKVEPAALADVEARFADRGAKLQAEIATLADPDLHALLASRGYEPKGFENVLGHPLSQEGDRLPDGVRVEPAGPADLHAWTDVVVEAFANPDTGGIGGDETPPPDELRRWFELTMEVPGFQGYLAYLDGQLAGGGALRIDGPVAQFAGAATLPRFRRRGVQTALLRARLTDARARGCEVGVVTTQPASKSQQNVQREGFSLLYARQLLVRQP